MTSATLKRRQHLLSYAKKQLDFLNQPKENGEQFTSFESKLNETGLDPLKPTKIDNFQINVGYMCNLTCGHCHVDAGPDRKEIMTRETMQECINSIKDTDISTVDLTGGAPEMNPDFRWFVEELSKINKKVIVRSNLTIILANPKYNDLPEFFAKHKVEVVCSMPHFTRLRTDSQRGDGVFDKSITALQMLNEVGYGKEGSGLMLHLVHNPSGAFMPGSQESLQKEFKKKLFDAFGIVFNDLYAITNLPISRYLDYLINSGNYENYMQKLIDSYNPDAARNVMCRNTISISWDGYLYDCDFNQMLEMKLKDEKLQHIKNFDLEALEAREILVDQHCYGCTAGSGSSCGGATS
jgi:radical SAM/Cys-rich protein